MRVTVTGASGLIGSRLVEALVARGDEVTALSRDRERARERLGVEAVAWNPEDEPAPASALSGRTGVVHLAGEPIAQRWSKDAKQRIVSSRGLGTRNLVLGLQEANPRPEVLVSASGVGYYGARGDERLDESSAPGDDFLADVCQVWERMAGEAAELGMRVAITRTGVVLDRSGGALETMLPPFRLGVGGPVAGGRQFVSWIHPDDLVGMYLAALDGAQWSGPVNTTAPHPATNRELSRALGRVLRRPAVLPLPGFVLRTLYGEMSWVVTTGQRAIPARAQELGFAFRHPNLDEALRAALQP